MMTQRLETSLLLLVGLLSWGVTTESFAGLEIIGKPPAKRSSRSSDAATSPKRVQVFGNGEVRELEPTQTTPEATTDYSRMLQEDAQALQQTPAPIDERVDDTEFQNLRSRARSRQVAEAPSFAGKTLSTDPEMLAPERRIYRSPYETSASRRHAKAAAIKPSMMQTEVITPQGPSRGTQVNTPRPQVLEAEESSQGPAYGAGESNAAFPYTHLLPSPFNIPQGAWVLGTTAAYGVFDFLQVSTNVVRLIDQHWNVEAKVPLIDFPTFMATAYVNYESYNPHHIAISNPDLNFSRWQPGIVTAYELSPDLALFVGGNFSFGKDPVPVTTTSGYMKGARLETDISWLYNPASSRLGDNALSLGVTYDTTYSLFGFGISHHWRSFTAGVHYTFADQNRFLPIFGFNLTAGF